MLPVKRRLRNRNDIKTLLAKGRSVFGNVVALKFRSNLMPISRFTVVVGVKIDKRAVVRNRLKRRVRAIIQDLIGKVKPGWDVCFFPKKVAIDISFKGLEKEMILILKKARLL
jgi:ribonuclease P protein component